MNRVMKIKELVLNNMSGFSVDFVTLNPLGKDKGKYCIALTDNSKKDLVKSIKSVLSASLLFKQIKGKLVLGGWYDDSANRYCLDLVLQEDNKESAMFMAKTFNQKAIFNIDTFEEIKNEDYNDN
jgi:hypothetical protein